MRKVISYFEPLQKIKIMTTDVKFTINLNGHAGITLFGINNAFFDADEMEQLFDENDDPDIIEGTMKDVIILDDTVRVRVKSVGTPFRSWSFTLELNDEKFPENPIEFRIKSDGRFEGAETVELP
ncbi:hypothetical protein [Dyadobacter sandarakinus]|uniref:Uncharacterized protein n=1 Tax=Dyadobacter sandarakinus TaxID=2747268 RepID=A0ABX7I5W4_9BACT|nr:hypothetical protein [Dyadobacter sandarakinus]QRR01489.1 hypothetical protein HWI92_11525 [Dyadobacter sandarakinus]